MNFTVCGHMLTGEMRTFTYAYNQTQSTDVIYVLCFYHLFHYLFLFYITFCKPKSNARRRYIVWDGCADMTRTSAGSDDDLITIA